MDDEGGQRRHPRHGVRVAAVGAVVALMVTLLVYWSDAGLLNAQSLADHVRAAGSLGPLALIALLITQAVVAPLPSPPILMAAGFVYGPWLGFAIGWLGLLFGASACFGLARRLGRPFAERFVRSEHLAVVDAYVTTRTGATFIALISMRVFMPPLFDAVSYGCGLVRLSFPWFVLATALGEVPKVASFAYIGAAAGGVSSWLTAWVLLAPAVGVVGLRLVRSRRKKTDAAAKSPCAGA